MRRRASATTVKVLSMKLSFRCDRGIKLSILVIGKQQQPKQSLRPNRTRTDDLLLVRQPLYPLSYRPVKILYKIRHLSQILIYFGPIGPK